MIGHKREALPIRIIVGEGGWRDDGGGKGRCVEGLECNIASRSIRWDVKITEADGDMIIGGISSLHSDGRRVIRSVGAVGKEQMQ